MDQSKPMKTKKETPTSTAATRLCRALRLLCCLFVALTMPFANRAATVWTGPTTTFVNVMAADVDQISPNVWLTRGTSQGIFNIKTEAAFTPFFSPADTEWANGTTANYGSLTYSDWNTWAKTINGGPPNTVGLNAVVHLISEDIYLDLKFTAWPVGGGFTYQRSTPAVANVPPTRSSPRR